MSYFGRQWTRSFFSQPMCSLAGTSRYAAETIARGARCLADEIFSSDLDYSALYGGWFEYIEWHTHLNKFKKTPYYVQAWRYDGEKITSVLPLILSFYDDDGDLLLFTMTHEQGVVRPSGYIVANVFSDNNSKNYFIDANTENHGGAHLIQGPTRTDEAPVLSVLRPSTAAVDGPPNLHRLTITPTDRNLNISYSDEFKAYLAERATTFFKYRPD